MASSYNSAYYYPNNQQSSTPPYSGYQTASASNTTSRQYQERPATTQSTEYMAYHSQTYNSGQGTGYGGAQDGTWTGSNYGRTSDTTSGRAAEVLRNMSNTAYNPDPASSSSSSGFTEANATSNSRYGTNQQPQTHSYGQTQAQRQARPRSVNANRAQNNTSRGLSSPSTATGYPSQRAQNLYNQQQQRPASPAQPQYSQAPAASSRSTAMPVTSQYNDYNSRQLPSVNVRSASNTSVTNSYSYSNAQAAAPLEQAPANIYSDQYTAGTTTVDPTAVYDPWPEYQRKQEALRQQRAEEERKAEEMRKEEECETEGECEKEEERMRKEEEERAREATKPKKSKSKTQRQMSTSAEAGPSDASGDALESEIRAMMAKMRELNSKDPTLLARIWEEERRAKASQSPTVQNKATLQPASAPQPIQASVPQAANQRKKAAPKETPATKPAAVATATPVAKQLGAPAGPLSSRPPGSTIWPAEKKTQLAKAASIYLNAQNASNSITPAEILSMLDGNPSYIELCEQLEGLGLTLDRAAFAKNLLTAVPDVNSTARPSQPKPTLNQVNGVQRITMPSPAIATKRDFGTPAALTPGYAPAAPPPAPFTPFPANNASASHSPVPVAEMVPIKAELKRPANKEEASRKRTFGDLVDLTVLSDDEDSTPAHKRANNSAAPSAMDPYGHKSMEYDRRASTPNNFPVAQHMPTPIQVGVAPMQPTANDVRFKNVVEPIDKNKALRRNTYNIKTIARDILLACGRHPGERQLNEHLEVLKASFPQINNDADLSTIRWDVIDPGNPPQGYYRDQNRVVEAEDADDEDDSDDEQRRRQTSQATSVANGARVHALPEPSNPFKPKRRGRPPRNSLPASFNGPATPSRATASASHSTSASEPRATALVGYSAFRSSTPQMGPDGQPLPKKRGRPVGWRKAIHGSPAAQATVQGKRYTETQKIKPFAPAHPSTLRNVNPGADEPIMIVSRSPSVSKAAPQYQSFKCHWQHCKAELHNLETLKKHVHKVHGKQTAQGSIQCLWDSCGREVTSIDPVTNMRIERHAPFTYTDDAQWRNHLEIKHFTPMSWDKGDGPASGLSDAHDSEAYLSDAQGRRVTPRITADTARFLSETAAHANASPSRGRGRPPKVKRVDSEDTVKQLINQKNRVGGPGMDRGGATLVNEKRRKGFSDHGDTEEDVFVDAEE